MENQTFQQRTDLRGQEQDGTCKRPLAGQNRIISAEMRSLNGHLGKWIPNTEAATHPVLPHQKCFNGELCMPCFGTDFLLYHSHW